MTKTLIRKITLALSLLCLMPVASLPQQQEAATAQQQQPTQKKLTYTDLVGNSEMDFVMPYGPTAVQRVVASFFALLGVVFFAYSSIKPFHVLAAGVFLISSAGETWASLMTQADNESSSKSSWMWTLPCLLVTLFALLSFLKKVAVYETCRCSQAVIFVPS